MDLNAVRAERQKWMTWKNIAPLRDALDQLRTIESTYELGNTVKLSSEESVDLEERWAPARHQPTRP